MYTIKFQDVLKQAVDNPGKLMAAYSAFYGYSIGNQLIAWSQCMARDLKIGPIATFKAWQSKGRSVKKGEKALALCMPITIKKDKEGSDDKDVFTRFMFRNNWFVMCQTEGNTVPMPAIPDWDQVRALAALGVTMVDFKCQDGNVQGYATKYKTVAINPMAQLPFKTLFHELGHIVLKHIEPSTHDDATLPKSLKEVEAESVALLCLEVLGLPGSEFCRGYIQNWIKGEGIPEKSAQKIMHAADVILKAGRDAVTTDVKEAA